jgi:hypothetical protein
VGAAPRRSVGLVVGIVLGLAALASAASAHAHGPPPWAAGASVVSAFEARITAIANEWIAAVSPYKRLVSFQCASPEEWTLLMKARGSDPNGVWGLTGFDADQRPGDSSALSPQACLHGNEFFADPASGRKTCQVGSERVYETVTRSVRKTKTVTRRVRGRTVRVRISYLATVSRRVALEQPVYGVCALWPLRVLAIQTLQHELHHLTGFFDEALADCMAIQTNAWMAFKLSGDAPLAAELADEMWALHQRGFGYPDPRCRDGADWDIAPEDPSWPAPTALVH